MKKLFLFIFLMATTTIVSATDLWEGTHAVNWDNTLTIEAAKFADAQVGQKIVVEFTNATGEVIELHSNGGMLPGTRFMHKLFADQNMRAADPDSEQRMGFKDRKPIRDQFFSNHRRMINFTLSGNTCNQETHSFGQAGNDGSPRKKRETKNKKNAYQNDLPFCPNILLL